MRERIYQLRLDGPPLDVTPEGFAGLAAPDKRSLGRFVHEVSTPYYVTSPTLAAAYLLEKVYAPFEQFEQEEMWVLLLNARRRITHEVLVYRGTINAISVRLADLFREAVRLNAASLVISHCHPSGDPTPSAEDIAVTRQALQAASLLDLTLDDHIIVGRDAWVSLRERGLGFEG